MLQIMKVTPWWGGLLMAGKRNRNRNRKWRAGKGKRGKVAKGNGTVALGQPRTPISVFDGHTHVYLQIHAHTYTVLVCVCVRLIWNVSLIKLKLWRVSLLGTCHVTVVCQVSTSWFVSLIVLYFNSNWAFRKYSPLPSQKRGLGPKWWLPLCCCSIRTWL